MSGGGGIVYDGQPAPVKIRRATPGDRDSLHFTIADGTSVDAEIRTFFDRPSVSTYVAERNGVVVGQVMTDDMPTEGRTDPADRRRIVRIFALFVAETERRTGIASALLDYAERDAANCDGFALQVEKSLPAVQVMYERRGYIAYADAEVIVTASDGRAVTTRNVAMWLQPVARGVSA